MNGKRAKAIRRHTNSRKDYLAAKDSFKHFVMSHAQQPKPVVERKRTPNDPARPTWPATADQRKQSRPVIVMQPVRQPRGLPRCAGGRARDIRASGSLPKHKLDRMAA